MRPDERYFVICASHFLSCVLECNWLRTPDEFTYVHTSCKHKKATKSHYNCSQLHLSFCKRCFCRISIMDPLKTLSSLHYKGTAYIIILYFFLKRVGTLTRLIRSAFFPQAPPRVRPKLNYACKSADKSQFTKLRSSGLTPSHSK